MSPILEARQLTRRFSGLVAVHDVSFTLSPREILGFIGPNGAGKTTLIS
ncbi:MAG: ATP-binding cassette domain-containing protein, partial [Castellaniella sp.]